MLSIKELTRQFPATGKVSWIGLRQEKRGPLTVVNSVQADPQSGLIGDRYQGTSGTRQVTLIQHEHLAVIATMLGLQQIPPETLRRNLLITGINLLALKDQRFQLGDAVLEYTGLCHPCSRMEEALGQGGYNAMRGHGGINARVISAGRIAVHDNLRVQAGE